MTAVDNKSRCRQHPEGDYLLNINKGRRITLFLNGDRNFFGAQMLVNRRQTRSWEAFLNASTQKTGVATAVRCITTPVTGTVIDDLDDLCDKQSYVAITRGKFKPIGYTTLCDRYKQYSTSNIHSTSSILKIRPVEHSHIQVPSKIADIPIHSIKINVYVNGKNFDAPFRISLNARVMRRWDLVLKEIGDRIKNIIPKALYTVDGSRIISRCADLQQGGDYVIVGNEPGGFKNYNYGYYHKLKNPKKLPPIKPRRKCRKKPKQQGKAGLVQSTPIDVNKPREGVVNTWPETTAAYAEPSSEVNLTVQETYSENLESKEAKKARTQALLVIPISLKPINCRSVKSASAAPNKELMSRRSVKSATVPSKSKPMPHRPIKSASYTTDKEPEPEKTLTVEEEQKVMEHKRSNQMLDEYRLAVEEKIGPEATAMVMLWPQPSEDCIEETKQIPEECIEETMQTLKCYEIIEENCERAAAHRNILIVNEMVCREKERPTNEKTHEPAIEEKVKPAAKKNEEKRKDKPTIAETNEDEGKVLPLNAIDKDEWKDNPTTTEKDDDEDEGKVLTSNAMDEDEWKDNPTTTEKDDEDEGKDWLTNEKDKGGWKDEPTTAEKEEDEDWLTDEKERLTNVWIKKTSTRERVLSSTRVREKVSETEAMPENELKVAETKSNTDGTNNIAPKDKPAGVYSLWDVTGSKEQLPVSDLKHSENETSELPAKDLTTPENLDHDLGQDDKDSIPDDRDSPLDVKDTNHDEKDTPPLEVKDTPPLEVEDTPPLEVKDTPPLEEKDTPPDEERVLQEFYPELDEKDQGHIEKSSVPVTSTIITSNTSFARKSVPCVSRSTSQPVVNRPCSRNKDISSRTERDPSPMAAESPDLYRIKNNERAPSGTYISTKSGKALAVPPSASRAKLERDSSYTELDDTKENAMCKTNIPPHR